MCPTQTTDSVDAVFAGTFDDALQKVLSTPSGAYAPPFVMPAFERPVNELANWQDRFLCNMPAGATDGAAPRTSGSMFFSANDGGEHMQYVESEAGDDGLGS